MPISCVAGAAARVTEEVGGGAEEKVVMCIEEEGAEEGIMVLPALEEGVDGVRTWS